MAKKITPLRKKRLLAVADAKYKRDYKNKKPKTVYKSSGSSGARHAFHIHTTDRMIGKQTARNNAILNASLDAESFTSVENKDYKQLFLIMFLFVVMFGSFMDGLLLDADSFDFRYNSVSDIMNSFNNKAIMTNISSYFVNGVGFGFGFIERIGGFARIVMDVVYGIYGWLNGEGLKDFVDWNFDINIGRYFRGVFSLDFWLGVFGQ